MKIVVFTRHFLQNPAALGYTLEQHGLRAALPLKKGGTNHDLDMFRHMPELPDEKNLIKTASGAAYLKKELETADVIFADNSLLPMLDELFLNKTTLHLVFLDMELDLTGLKPEYREMAEKENRSFEESGLSEIVRWLSSGKEKRPALWPECAYQAGIIRDYMDGKALKKTVMSATAQLRRVKNIETIITQCADMGILEWTDEPGKIRTENAETGEPLKCPVENLAAELSGNKERIGDLLFYWLGKNITIGLPEDPASAKAKHLEEA